MTFSLTTLVVVTSNTITAIISAGLLMLVLWQAPARRMNQMFAVAMFMLVGYSVSNAFGRFIGDMGWDPYHATYVAISFYGFFNMSIFWFASEFAYNRTPLARFMRIMGVILIFTVMAALWSNRLVGTIEPTANQDGSYRAEWSPLGMVVLATQAMYLIATAAILYRMQDERGRALWKAPAWVVMGMIYSGIVWPIIQIPVQAVFLAIGALALGLPVLRFELFHPQARLHAELAQTNRDLLEMSRLKTQFLRNMSRELRTPLNSIIGYTQMLMSGTYGTLDEKQLDRLEIVIRNGYNLLRLINDVLDLNRIETGRVKLERRQLDARLLLNQVLDAMDVQAARKDLVLMRMFDNVPAAYADETRLRQIVTNIVANAIKFTDSGSVTVRAHPVDDAFIQIEVEDTGIGIPRAEWDTVFEEFRQVDESATRRHEGTGLGMAISKRLVELHDGQIWLTSTEGQGTTFYVRLPICPPADAASESAPVALAAVPIAAVEA